MWENSLMQNDTLYEERYGLGSYLYVLCRRCSSIQSSDHTIDGRIKKWENKKCLTFQDNVDKENLNGLCNELTNSINENITKDNINASVKKLCDLCVDSAQTTLGTLGTYKNKRKNLNRKPKGDKPWFNYECKFARKNYRKLKRKFKKERSEKSNGG